MVFASLDAQINVKTTSIASLEPLMVAKTTVFVSLKAQIIVKQLYLPPSTLKSS
jgi:hypothetical protein